MKSLDDLIRFLLEEIALCGNHGQSSSHYPAFTSTFDVAPLVAHSSSRPFWRE